jgi:hypothetical protein
VPEQIWLGKFNIVAGQPQEDGPFAASFPDRHAAGATVDLYLVVQPTRPDTDGLCEEIERAIDGAFGHTEYSVTGNLLLACGAAHQRLREWNRSSLPEHQMAVGLTLLALSGGEAYLAQIGPSTAFYRHAGRLDRLEPLEPESRRALGLDDTLAPWFHRLQLGETDTVLLLSGNVGERAEARALDHLLSLDPETALSEVFRYVRDEPNVGAVLLSVLGELSRAPGSDGADDAPSPLGQGARPAAQPPRAATPRPAQPERDAPRPPDPIPEQPFRRRPPSPLGRTSFGFELPPEILDEPPLDGEAPSRGAFQQLVAGLDSFRRVKAAHPDEGRGVLRVIGDERPRQPLTRSPFALPSAEAVLEASDSIARSRVAMRPSAPGFRAPFPLLAVARVNRKFVIGGLAAAALGAVLLLGLPALNSAGASQRFSTLLNSTKTELASAQNEQDPAKRRELLNQALSNIDEARRLRPGDPQAQSAASSVSDAVSTLDAVYNLPSVPALADLSAAGLTPSANVEIAAGDRFYVLDAAAGKVIGVPRDASAQPEVIYETGASVDGVQGGKAVHIAWEPSASAGDTGTLLILDAQRHLFGYSRLQLRGVPLHGVEEWKSAAALSFANGDLYILDNTAGLVWRYTPSQDGGFNTDPAPAVARADIKAATDMSVVGGVFLVGQDGRIHRYLDGQESDFTMPGIDKLPAAPEPPLYDPANGALYVADRAGGRILVLQGDGRFQRQLVNTQLTALRGISVDPGEKRLVGVAGQTLVAIPLPQ